MALWPGKPLGSYSTWAAWCRDPLLALGCADPVERVEELAAADPLRQDILAIFTAWRERHAGAAVEAKNLHEEVRQLIDPKGRGRQHVTHFLDSLAGPPAARLGGFVFTRDKDPERPRNPATYKLKEAKQEDAEMRRVFVDFHAWTRAGMTPITSDARKSKGSYVMAHDPRV